MKGIVEKNSVNSFKWFVCICWAFDFKFELLEKHVICVSLLFQAFDAICSIKEKTRCYLSCDLLIFALCVLLQLHLCGCCYWFDAFDTRWHRRDNRFFIFEIALINCVHEIDFLFRLVWFSMIFSFFQICFVIILKKCNFWTEIYILLS